MKTALFSGPVALTATGGRAPLALPDFNGQRADGGGPDRTGSAKPEAAAGARPTGGAVYLPRFWHRRTKADHRDRAESERSTGRLSTACSADGAGAVDEPATFTFTVTDLPSFRTVGPSPCAVW
ncbi:MAG: hypothetical protein R3F36_13805 [Candidatus Competibacteraceae bacterium]